MPLFNKENVLTLICEKNVQNALGTSVDAKIQKNVEFDPETEPLLKENPTRFVVFPIEYPDIWAKYKHAEALFWTTGEIDLSRDLKDWENLADHERFFIAHTLAFLSTTNGIVNENLLHTFTQEVQVTEARCFYGYQIANENIHSEMYSILIETYISDPQEKEFLYNATETLPFIKNKASWAFKWLHSKSVSFGERLVAFAAIEGLFFAGSSAALFWLKKQGLLPGLTSAHELISRDERLHCDFACLMFSHLVQKTSKQRIRSIIEEAVKLEQEFLVETLQNTFVGLNCELICKYVEFVADWLLVELRCEKMYNVKNPFDFIEVISNSEQGDRSEKPVQKSTVLCKDNDEYVLDADF